VSSSEAPVLSYGMSSSRDVCISCDPDRRPAARRARAAVAASCGGSFYQLVAVLPRISLPTPYRAAAMVGSVPWIAYGEEHTGHAVCAAGRRHIAWCRCVVARTLFIRLIMLQ
jgi:hypothetical protein